VWRYSRPLVNGSPQKQTFVYEEASNPFQVVVQPIAAVQLKVMPWTIVYQPPGDKSSASYAYTQSYGTNMTTTDLVTQGQSTAVDNKFTEGSSGGGTFSFNTLLTLAGVPGFGVGGSGGSGGSGSGSGSGTPPLDMGVADFLKAANFSVSAMMTSSTTWDNTTLLGSGRSTQTAVSNAAAFTAIQTFTLAKNGISSLIPGAGGTYAQEPFWDDTFLLLVHPQFGIWQANGTNAVILLGAEGGPSGPAVFAPTVFELDECARQAPGFENGLVINTATDKNFGSPADILNANDCLQLLQLDPFYGVGQTIPMAPNARIAVAQSGPSSVNYGTTGDSTNHSDLNVSLSQALTYTSVTTATNVASYNGAVTSALTSANTNTFSLSAFGISGGENSSDSETTTNVSTWSMQFQSSQAATALSSTTVTGTLDDDHILSVRPAAFVFQDTAFGGFMFQDLAAPLPPAP
jgi:hypothetical protein